MTSQATAAAVISTPRVMAVFSTTVSTVIRPVPRSVCVGEPPTPRSWVAEKSAYPVWAPRPLNSSLLAKTGFLLCIVPSRDVDSTAKSLLALYPTHGTAVLLPNHAFVRNSGGPVPGETMLPLMWVGVLGPAVARDPSDPGRAVPLKAAKHRALLAALALHHGRPVGADVLVEALWGPDAPDSAHATLHTYLSVVRRTLEP